MSFEKMYIVWICAAIIFGVLEAVTVQLVSVWCCRMQKYKRLEVGK